MTSTDAVPKSVPSTVASDGWPGGSGLHDVSPVRRARRVPRRRRAIVLGSLAALLVAAFAVRVLLGDYTYTIPDFFRILFGEEIPVASYLLMESKLPRAVLAVLVGAALGASGAVFQTLLRNPLASPDVVGVSAGASAAGIFAILGLGLRGDVVSVFAVVGALGVAIAVRWIAGGAGGYRLVLVGVGMASAMSAVIFYLIARARIYDVQLALRWLTGSLNNVGWDSVRVLGMALLVLVPLLVWFGRALPVLEMGDDVARGFGVAPWRADALLAISVLLVAMAVSVAGPTAFVAFVSGPIARGLNGGRTSIVGAALVGAIVVLSADYVAAYAVPDVSIPVGVVTGAVGAPFLLWLLGRGAAGRSSS